MPADLRKTAEVIFGAALDAADPARAVLSRADHIRGVYASGGFGRLVVVSFGKAASAMASALEGSIGDLMDDAIVITKYGHLASRHKAGTRTFEAGHPVPDENGLAATMEAIRLVKGADGKTLVVCLISGGGSALLVAPQEGISLAEKQEITNRLLRAGADINELNAVRKHLSAVKGGRLALDALPAKVISLIISDVIGDSLDVIASGPTAPDASTFVDALKVVERYGVSGPANALDLLRKGAEGLLPETPKPGDPGFEGVENIIVGGNRAALEAAMAKARQLGFDAHIISDSLTGEATEAARWLLAQAERFGGRPCCLISGGETTVTVRGKGKGGRNTELALAFALGLGKGRRATLLSAGTDGTDGPTDAAGAVVDETTIPNSLKMGLDPDRYLRENDSYSFFKEAGGLLVTGPTGTNVMDVQVILQGVENRTTG